MNLVNTIVDTIYSEFLSGGIVCPDKECPEIVCPETSNTLLVLFWLLLFLCLALVAMLFRTISCISEFKAENDKLKAENEENESFYQNLHNDYSDLQGFYEKLRVDYDKLEAENQRVGSGRRSCPGFHGQNLHV